MFFNFQGVLRRLKIVEVLLFSIFLALLGMRLDRADHLNYLVVFFPLFSFLGVYALEDWLHYRFKYELHVLMCLLPHHFFGCLVLFNCSLDMVLRAEEEARAQGCYTPDSTDT